MDYERKYKKALEMAQKLYQDCPNGKNDRLYHTTDLEKMFPELKESEDERISKEIIKYLERTVPHHHRDEVLKSKEWTAWLEKQGESYTKRDVDDAYVEGMALAKNELEKQGNSPIKWNKNTEGNKPKVNHSVLMKTTHGVAEGEWKGEYWEQYRWAGIVRDSDVLSWIEFSDLEKQGEQKPTLRERYKNIAESEWFKKTHEGMSVSDDEKVDNVNKIEQKPAWSIKEKLMLNDIIEATERSNIFKEDYQRELIDWLKSLKQRIGG